ncbi:MAG: hypothetical protein ABSH47_03220 [Bryobacteraceae bacterium]|jgi:hypothetical protein
MSACVVEDRDRDILKKFPAAVYQVPNFVQERRLFKAVGHRHKPAAKLPSQIVVAKDLKKRIDTHLHRLLVTAQSAEQFQELRQEIFPEYVELSGAIGTLARIFDSRKDLTAVVNEAFAAIKALLGSDTCILDGYSGAKDEAFFCLDSLHRAHFLAQDVITAISQGILPPDSLNGYQAAISQEWWSLLHLHCISFAIDRRIQPTGEVFLCLMDGFRHSVMSYAAARAAMEPKYRADYAVVDFSSLSPGYDDLYPTDGCHKA